MEIPIVDQFHDPSFKMLYGLIRDFPQTEDQIKTASIEDSENAQRPDSAFAWQSRRMFPIDSPDQAAISRMYMEKQAGVPAAVRDRCDKALRLYGVELDLRQVKTAAPVVDDSDYLLPKLHRFMVRTAEDVKLAAAAILTNQKRLDADSRAQACTRLVKKAVALKVDLPVGIYKMAGVTMSYTPNMKDWLEARAEAVKDPAIRGAYLKLAEAARKSERFVNNRDELVKMASVIGELDEAAGLTQFYDRQLPDPMQTVFNTDKISEETVELAGRAIPLSALLMLPPEVYGDVLGEDLASEFIQNGEVDPEQVKVILPTVPLDLQQALLANTGI